jgi:spermidine synthase
MSFPFALVLSALSGFISLSYEILWYRASSVGTAASAATFGLLLGMYLLGLGFGSFAARALCRDTTRGGQPGLLRALGTIIFLANLVAFAVLPLMARLLARGSDPWMLVTFAGAMLGTCFPLIGHLGVKPDHLAGARTSYLYLSNVVGSALGSTLTGYLLLDVWPLSRVAQLLALVGIGVGLLLFVMAETRQSSRLLAGGVAVGVALAVQQLSPAAFDGFWERLVYKQLYTPEKRFAHVVESRHGVIAVTPDGTVYGGGAYDGRVNVDPKHDTNGILRAYFTSALKPNAEEVLMIGLATGGWAQVIAHAPGLKRLVVVEISPSYLPLIAQYPEVASLLHNPKVEIVIDDGRRWMQRHPEARFDLIVQNTTWHWRANASELLSREYLQLSRLHLKPGGVLYYNTTLSLAALRTGLTLFPHALRVGTFLAVSDSPLQPDLDAWRTVLVHYQLDGRPLIDPQSSADHDWLDGLIAHLRQYHGIDERIFGLEERDRLVARTASAPIVTDDNMVVEWAPELHRP